MHGQRLDTHHCQPSGAAGHCGSGVQSEGGRQPSGGGGHPGGASNCADGGGELRTRRNAPIARHGIDATDIAIEA